MMKAKGWDMLHVGNQLLSRKDGRRIYFSQINERILHEHETFGMEVSQAFAIHGSKRTHQ